MADFNVQPADVGGNIFQNTLASEQQARSFEGPREPSTAEKAAAALPGLISAGVSLYGAAKQKQQDNELRAKQEEVAKTLQPVMQGLSQGTLTGGAAKINLNALVRTKSAEFLERGDLEGHEMLLKAAEGVKAGKTGDSLFALSPEEQLLAIQSEAQGKAEAAKQLFIAEGRGTADDYEKMNRAESGRKMSEDNLARVRADSAMSAPMVSRAYVEAGKANVEAIELNLAAALRGVDMNSPEAASQMSAMWRGAKQEVSGYYNDLIAGAASMRDPTERNNLINMLKEQRDDRLKVMDSQDIQNIISQDKTLAQDLIQLTASKELPDLAVMNAAGGQEGVKSLLAAKQNPALFEQLKRASPIFGELADKNQSSLISKTLGGIVKGQVEGLDPNQVTAMTSYAINTPTMPPAVKDEVMKNHMDRLKSMASDAQFNDMRMYLTSTGRSQVYSSKENQQRFAAGFDHATIQHAKAFKNKLQRFIGPEGKIPEGTKVKLSLTKDKNKFSPSIENLGELYKKPDGMEDHIGANYRNFLISEMGTIGNMVSQAALYEDLVTKDGETLSDYFKRHFGFEVEVDMRSGKF